MQINSTEDLNSYYETVVATENSVQKWNKSRLVVVTSGDGSTHLVARKLSFLERIGTRFNGPASLQQVVEYCDAHHFTSAQLHKAVTQYNAKYCTNITYKEGIANEISNFVKMMILPKFEPRHLYDILIQYNHKNSSKPRPDMYDILARIKPKSLGQCIFFSLYSQEKIVHEHRLLTIRLQPHMKQADLLSLLSQDKSVQHAVCLTKDIYPNIWIPYTPNEDSAVEEELCDADQFAVGIVDTSGKGTVYEVLPFEMEPDQTDLSWDSLN